MHQAITLPSPVLEVSLEILQKHKVKLLIKREDLIHPTVSGNKWRKLKGNLALAKQQHKGIITFGGAFSNHIYATAAACNMAELPCLGIIRGEYDPKNPTLKFAQSQGMKLAFVSRAAYREKDSHLEIAEILAQYPDHLVVPEGGSSELALQGLAELANEIEACQNIDLITVAAGTGMTAAGIIKYQTCPVRIYSALKSDHLAKEIKLIAGANNFTFVSENRHGGYGRTSPELIAFINSFKKQAGIPLDPIYNGKALFCLLEEVAKGSFPKGTTILHIHTGGLQGIEAYNYMAEKKKTGLLIG